MNVTKKTKTNKINKKNTDRLSPKWKIWVKEKLIDKRRLQGKKGQVLSLNKNEINNNGTEVIQ